MKSVQTMLSAPLACVMALVVVCVGACGPRRPLVAPRVTVAPYSTLDGETLWAVAPLRNESGTTAVDPLRVADALAEAASEVRGVRCLPVNRTLDAMEALGMYQGVRTPEEAKQLAAALGADAIVVGSVIAYDPYNPPKLGLALALYPVHRHAATSVDPRRLSSAPTDYTNTTARFGPNPGASVELIADARDHTTLLRLEDYARGRTDAESDPAGWRTHLLSMDLYTDYAAWEAVRALIDAEWIRLARENRDQITGG